MKKLHAHNQKHSYFSICFHMSQNKMYITSHTPFIVTYPIYCHLSIYCHLTYLLSARVKQREIEEKGLSTFTRMYKLREVQ